MGETTIEWAHYTFNPWRGCARVSPGCTHCYAETWAKRNPAVFGTWGVDGARVVASDAYWREPVKWNAKAERTGERRRVFCASLADVLEDRRDLDAPRARLWDLIAKTSALDWLLLTKRPENFQHLAPGPLPRNVWMGTTTEDQQRADERIPHLLQIDASVRFLSVEPLLGPVVLRGPLQACGDCDPCLGGCPQSCAVGAYWLNPLNVDGIHWVICGGESGHGARPMHPEWALSIRDQCVTAGVAFHFKQTGEWAWDVPTLIPGEPRLWVNRDGRSTRSADEACADGGTWQGFWRVGKKAAGRLLDGRTWDQFPVPD